MVFDPDIHRRRSIRLPGYDYANAGAYFVTLCVQGRECLLGEVRDANMAMNEAGEMVETIWSQLPEYHPAIQVDTHIVMPNHFHGIIWLLATDRTPYTSTPKITTSVGAGPRACPVSAGPRACQTDYADLHQGHPQGGAPTWSLFDVVHRFKSMTTAQYRHGVYQTAWPPFACRLWQRNYYERVIRDDRELALARQYIADNPANWPKDKENPAP